MSDVLPKRPTCFIFKVFLPEINLDRALSNNIIFRGAAIAPWFHLRLPSCGPRFESQAHHLRFFQIVLLKLLLELEKNENKQKKAGIGPYF